MSIANSIVRLVAVLMVLIVPEGMRPKYDACKDECEVLEMTLVRRVGCNCVCFDPVERIRVTIPSPDCIDRE